MGVSPAAEKSAQEGPGQLHGPSVHISFSRGSAPPTLAPPLEPIRTMEKNMVIQRRVHKIQSAQLSDLLLSLMLSFKNALSYSRKDFKADEHL
jgi:hypothetical protein